MIPKSLFRSTSKLLLPAFLPMLASSATLLFDPFESSTLEEWHFQGVIFDPAIDSVVADAPVKMGIIEKNAAGIAIIDGELQFKKGFHSSGQRGVFMGWQDGFMSGESTTPASKVVLEILGPVDFTEKKKEEAYGVHGLIRYVDAQDSIRFARTSRYVKEGGILILDSLEFLSVDTNAFYLSGKSLTEAEKLQAVSNITAVGVYLITSGGNWVHSPSRVGGFLARGQITAPLRSLRAPLTRELTAGDTITLRSAILGTAPLSFTWLKDGVPVPGESGEDFVFATTLADSGTFSFKVGAQSGVDTVLSSEATLTVLAAKPVEIIAMPEPWTAVEIQDVQWEVKVAGSGPITYQWLKDGVALNGETNAGLWLRNLTLNDSGLYSVIVSNRLGTDTTDATKLSVDAGIPVSIADFPSAIYVAEGGKSTVSISADGNGRIEYFWYKNGAELKHSEKPTYVVVGDSTNPDGTQYYVIAQNPYFKGKYLFADTSVTASVVVVTVPEITAQPTSVTVRAGASATMSVQAQGKVRLRYQWLRDGSPIEGATSAELALDSVTLADVGMYSVHVSDTLGVSTTSQSAQLSVEPAVGLLLGEGALAPLQLKGNALYWNAALRVRILDSRGRALFDHRGLAGDRRELSESTLRNLGQGKLKLRFSPM